MPCANAVFYSFIHAEADFSLSVLGCLIPTEIHLLHSHLCTPVPQQLPSTTGTIKCWSRIPTPALRVEELLNSQRVISHPEMLAYSREREQTNPSEEVPHLPVASRNTQAHARSEHTWPPIPLPFGTRCQGWSLQRKRRQRAGCLQGNNSALSSVTFGFSTQVSMLCLEKVTGEGGRQKYFVFFQPGWSNSMTVTPRISFLALRETGHQERQNSSMEGCKRELLSLAFPQKHHQPFHQISPSPITSAYPVQNNLQSTR